MGKTHIFRRAGPYAVSIGSAVPSKSFITDSFRERPGMLPAVELMMPAMPHIWTNVFPTQRPAETRIRQSGLISRYRDPSRGQTRSLPSRSPLALIQPMRLPGTPAIKAKSGTFPVTDASCRNESKSAELMTTPHDSGVRADSDTAANEG